MHESRLSKFINNQDLDNFWTSIKWQHLPASAKVDLTQFIAQIKPAIRTKLLCKAYASELIQLIHSYGWYFAGDGEGYVVIAREKNLPKMIMDVDQSNQPHENQLGLLLGYPSCCCRFVSERGGENNIDELASKRKKIEFKGEYTLIDVSHYLEGISLLSHVPCSYQCFPSLRIAKEMKNFIHQHKECESFSLWSSELARYYQF